MVQVLLQLQLPEVDSEVLPGQDLSRDCKVLLLHKKVQLVVVVVAEELLEVEEEEVKFVDVEEDVVAEEQSQTNLLPQLLILMPSLKLMLIKSQSKPVLANERAVQDMHKEPVPNKECESL